MISVLIGSLLANNLPVSRLFYSLINDLKVGKHRSVDVKLNEQLLSRVVSSGQR